MLNENLYTGHLGKISGALHHQAVPNTNIFLQPLPLLQKAPSNRTRINTRHLATRLAPKIPTVSTNIRAPALIIHMILTTRPNMPAPQETHMISVTSKRLTPVETTITICIRALQGVHIIPTHLVTTNICHLSTKTHTLATHFMTPHPQPKSTSPTSTQRQPITSLRFTTVQ